MPPERSDPQSNPPTVADTPPPPAASTYSPDPSPPHAPPPSTAPSKVPYLVVLGVMAALSVIVVLGTMVARPTEDNAVIIGLALASIAALTGQILTYLKSDETSKVSAATHLSVNSQLDQWKKDFGQVAYKRGIEDAQMVAMIAATAAANAASVVLERVNSELTQQKILTASIAGKAAVPVDVKAKIEPQETK